MPFITEGQSVDDAKTNPVPNYEVITPRYFLAMGIPLTAGRHFTEQDVVQAPQVAIISESMARRLFPNTDPLGKRIRLNPADPQTPWRTIVGIVGDAQYRQVGDFRMDVYVPYRQTPVPTRYLTIRTTTDPENLTPAVRRAVAAIDPDRAVTGIMTGEQLVARAISRPRFNALLLTFLAIIAATLALIGIYGIVTYMVTQRTREIGIRLALGAQTRDVRKLIVGQGMKLVLLGIGTGLIVAFITTRMLASLLYNTSTTDRSTFVGVPLLLALVALIACLVPTRKATRVDPTIALRQE
jgi:putative ABC transport system permease protein